MDRRNFLIGSMGLLGYSIIPLSEYQRRDIVDKRSNQERYVYVNCERNSGGCLPLTNLEFSSTVDDKTARHLLSILSVYAGDPDVVVTYRGPAIFEEFIPQGFELVINGDN
jgi:hypothetical protein